MENGRVYTSNDISLTDTETQFPEKFQIDFISNYLQTQKEKMKTNLLLTSLVLLVLTGTTHAQELESKHDPKFDMNLSPTLNPVINPEKNANINPKLNWNINPMHNSEINPGLNISINPIDQFGLNPGKNKELNPMFHNEFHPRNPAWKGLYLFNKHDELVGYISVASNSLMLCFDKQSEWTGYFVRAGETIYNYFDTTGGWTGEYLCFDSKIGFNLFDKDGNWTGEHIK